MTRRVLVSIGLSLLFLAVGSGIFLVLKSARRDPERRGDGPSRVAVQTLTLAREPYQEVLGGYGMARALRETRVVAEVSAVVEWISPALEAGQTVVEGQDLVRLDTRDLATAEAAASALLRQAEATFAARQIEGKSILKRIVLVQREYAAAKRELDRQKQLEGSNLSASQLDAQVQRTALSERTLLGLEWRQEENLSEVDKARAEVALREAEHKKASYDFERAVIRAPYSGSIVTREVQLGARVGPETELFLMVDTSRVEVPVAVPARHFGEVRVGASAAVRLREDGEVVWRGPVARIAPIVNQKDRTFFVFLEIEGADGSSPVPSGAFVMSEIEGRRHESVIAVPRIAFVDDRVFVIDRTDGETQGAVVRDRRPRVLRFLPDVALVAAGLEPGEEVVLTSVEEIDLGTRVSVVPEAEGGSTSPVQRAEGLPVPKGVADS